MREKKKFQIDNRIRLAQAYDVIREEGEKIMFTDEFKECFDFAWEKLDRKVNNGTLDLSSVAELEDYNLKFLWKLCYFALTHFIGSHYGSLNHRGEVKLMWVVFHVKKGVIGF